MAVSSTDSTPLAVARILLTGLPARAKTCVTAPERMDCTWSVRGVTMSTVAFEMSIDAAR